MEVAIEEQDVRAVYFYSDDYDDAKLLAEAAKFLEKLQQRPGKLWLLLGTNHQPDEFGDHLTLFLEKRPVTAPRPSPPTAGLSNEDVKIRYL